ncbi:PQQ-binding-like beta-propeller repeat protein [Actinocorallia sp. API 0066]|uniref:serine/threonine-protein kinase n=1 Tax=Actinocorallia sp. API 0066 TaxID=2896846 RepID=UPI001E5A9D79|nr:serine/threonine-protein kinase [Actinocorallia sp. API 0066]MCD0448757.1 PQQ-binding-like beta-propeller repeat protein [Actinocorallia sp. API 0066]
MAFYGTDGVMAETIGPFRIVRLLGEGGMGRVFLGTSPSGRQVAVKVVRPELASDPGFRRRFRAEVEAAMAVSGAFTTPVVDADPEGPLPWLATVYVPGPSLQSRIEDAGPLVASEAATLGARLAEALAAIHRAGLIHRDLKPSNILLADDGPRVIDFGISRASEGTVFTATGNVIGSAGYMSPEQVAGHELTPASDVFALGAVMVFAVTGTPAFGTGPFQVLMFRAAYEPPNLTDVPPRLLDLLTACLDKDASRRPSVASLPELFINGTPLPYPADPASARPPATFATDASVRHAATPPTAPPPPVAVTGPSGAAFPQPSAPAAATSQEDAAPFTAPVVPLQQPPESAVVPLLPPAPPPVPGTAPGQAPPVSRRGVLLGGVGLAVTAVAGGAWAAYARDRDTSGETLKPQAGPSAAGDGQPVWTARLSEDYATLQWTGDLVLALYKDVEAFDPRDGRLVWSNGDHNAFYPPKYLDGSVYTLSGNELSALDARTGEKLWTTGIDVDVESPQPITSSVVIARGKDIRAHAFDAKTGDPLWTLGTKADPIYVNRVVVDDVMLADTRFRKTGNRYAGIALSNGDPVWIRSGKLLACHTDGKRFYVLDEDLKARALDPRTGKELWASPSGMPKYRAKENEPSYWLTIEAGLLVASSGTPNRLAVFDPATGRRPWSAKTVASATHLLSGTTLCHGNGTYHALDLTTGKSLWTTEVAPVSEAHLLPGPDTLATIATDAGLQAWDVTTGQKAPWSHPATPDADSYKWSALRTPDRLITKYDRDLAAFTAPGTTATTYV